MFTHHNKERMMDKFPTEGQGLFLMIAIFFGGTFLLNAIVHGFFMS